RLIRAKLLRRVHRLCTCLHMLQYANGCLLFQSLLPFSPDSGVLPLPGGSLNQGLSRVTFVIPTLNEANNLCGLRETLGKQIVPPGIELEVVISDNGSHQETLNQERALEIGGKH